MTDSAAGAETLLWILTEEDEGLLFAICSAGLLLLAVCYYEQDWLSFNFFLGQLAQAKKENDDVKDFVSINMDTHLNSGM